MDERQKISGELEFHTIWNDSEMISKAPLDVVFNLILTNSTVKTCGPDFGYFPVFGKKLGNARILDFGCGVGRNTFALAEYSPSWEIYGYDSELMLSRVNEFKNEKYPDKEFPNIKFVSDWKSLTNIRFDWIFANIVFQHIYEEYLIKYLEDFKVITNNFLVHGRKRNDDNGKNTWAIIEKCGLYPVVCFEPDRVGRMMIREYDPESWSENDHKLAIYSI